MNTKDNKIKIIFIAGTGHSGSTLLNRILSVSKKAFSVGEVMLLERYANKKKIFDYYKDNNNNNKYLCDCENELSNCIFWSPILKEINLKKTYESGLTFSEKIKTIPKSFQKTKKKKNPEEEKLFSLILSQSKKIKNKNVEYIIDSSKTINRLIYLNEIEKFDIFVIHLVRDGRSVINSHRKVNLNTFITYIYWIIDNILLKIYIKKNFQKKNIYIRYEELVKNPEKIIKEINNKIDLNINYNNLIDNMNKEEIHIFAGNPGRKKTIKNFYYDASWKKELSKAQIFIFNILTYIPNKKWIYDKKNK